MSDELASNTLQRWKRMTSARSNFANLWEEVARYCVPRKGNIVTSKMQGTDLEGGLYDSTAGDAGLVFAAGCVTHICPAGEKWLRLESKNKNPEANVKEWWDDCTDRLIDLIYDSNFYEGILEDFNDAGHFGTSMLLVDDDPEAIVNFVNIPVGRFSIMENARGQVDTVARDWKWSARQAAQQWGRDALGKQLLEALDSKEPGQQDREFQFVHFVEPRPGVKYKGGDAAPELRPWSSVYVCVEDECVLEHGGYYSMPYPTSRLLRSNGEVYGRGPGTEKLDYIRMVNAMMRDMLVAAEKGINPAWLMGEEQPLDPDNSPGGVTYWDTTNAAGKPEQLQSKADLKGCEVMIEKVQRKIEKGYYNDLFQMLMTLDQQKRQKTAYEVQQMVAEQLLLFSPLFSRLCREKLSPTITRTFDIACRLSRPFWLRGQDGFLKLPPAELNESPGYNVVYVSKIALAIKSAENQSFATMMTLVEQAAALDPSVVHVVDWQGGIRAVARNVALPTRLIRTERDVAKRMQAQAQAQAQATGAQQAQAATQAVKNLGPEAQNAAARQIIANSDKAA